MGAHLDHEETIPRKLLYRGGVDRRQPAARRRRLGRLGEERGVVLLRVVEVDAVGPEAVEHLRLGLAGRGRRHELRQPPLELLRLWEAGAPPHVARLRYTLGSPQLSRSSFGAA